MKQLSVPLLFAALFVICLQSMGQPILALNDILLEEGENYTLALVEVMESDMPEIGNNLAWDYSSFGEVTVEVASEVIAPADVPGGPDVPEADLVFGTVLTSFVNYSYIDVGEDFLATVHQFNQNFGSTTYSDPEKFGGFPFTRVFLLAIHLMIKWKCQLPSPIFRELPQWNMPGMVPSALQRVLFKTRCS